MGCRRPVTERAALRRREALARHAARAKQWESRADEVVKELSSTVRRISGTEVFRGIVESDDDAADHLEDAAFLTRLLFDGAPPAELPEPVLVLADLLADGTQAFRRTMDFAHRDGARDAARRFPEAAERVVAVEHQTDERAPPHKAPPSRRPEAIVTEAGDNASGASSRR